MINNDMIFRLLNKPIDEIGFSVRVRNDCKILKVNQLFELVEKFKNKDQEFLEIFGKKSREEIKDKLLMKGIDIEKLTLDENFKNRVYQYAAATELPIINN